MSKCRNALESLRTFSKEFASKLQQKSSGVQESGNSVTPNIETKIGCLAPQV